MQESGASLATALASSHSPEVKKKGLNPLAWILILSGSFFALFMIASAMLFMRNPSDSEGRFNSLIGGGGAGSGAVGVVEIDGIIMDSRKAVKRIQQLEKDPEVKAVLVRINSPGGAVGPSQEIYDSLVRLKKPTIASMGSIAASGGYYIAAGTKRVFANAGTLTGSIGVIMEFANLEKLYEWAKVQRYAIKTGKFKSIGADYRAMSDEERQLLQALVDDVLSQFVEAVSKGRNLPTEKVREIADGRIFSGSQALGLGLIDEVGGMEAAIEAAAKLGGIEGKPRVLYPRDDRSRLLDLLMSGEGESEEGRSRSFLESIFWRIQAPISSAAALQPGLYWIWSGAR